MSVSIGLVLQAFAEPWQQGTAAASGQEASSADAAVPQLQVNQPIAGVVEGQAPYHETVPQQQHVLAHPQSANANADAFEQPSLPIANEHEEVHQDIRAQLNLGHSSDNNTFVLPASQFHEGDPSNSDGKLMSLLMG